MTDEAKIIAYYNDNAKELADKYASLQPEKLYKEVLLVLDTAVDWGKSTHGILDIGGGMGRDALFFSNRYKCEVTVVEPAEKLREQMAAYFTANNFEIMGQDETMTVFADSTSANTIWVGNLTLGKLNERFNRLLVGSEFLKPFSFINVNAVWQHIPPEQRIETAEALTLILAEGGVLSVKGRDKPTPEQEGIAWDVTAEELRDQFPYLQEVLIEEQPDYSKPGSDFKFINGIFRKPQP